MPRRVFLHPDAPKRLKALYRELKSMHEIARQRGVNVRYVHDLLRRGRVPTNHEIGNKLFVEYRSFTRLDLGDARRKHIRWFVKLPRTERSQLIQLLYLNHDHLPKGHSHARSHSKRHAVRRRRAG